MITPEEIRAKALRHWDSHAYHRERLVGQPWHALSIPFGKPRGRQLLDQFAFMAASLEVLRTTSKEVLGYGYHIEFAEIAHRHLGVQALPSRISFATEEDFLRFIGKSREAARFKELALVTRQRQPALAELLLAKPRLLLDHLPVWEKLLDVAAWFVDHPRPGIYPRQIDLPGIDSKFIEQHTTSLSALLNTILPESAIDGAEKSFEKRYGLRYDQHLIRFRLLDPALALAGLSDLAVPAGDFQRLRLPMHTVFVTENKVNGLAFPSMARAMVIFALGYGLGSLAGAAWLKSVRLVYWGDLDTHGFTMLARLREIFPHAESMLMDAATLETNRTLCVSEPSPVADMPALLTPSEAAAFTTLRQGKGSALRLEQERIPFHQVEQALRKIGC